MHKISIVATVKAPEQELIHFVKHHINLGVDFIILYFDSPGDVPAIFFENSRVIVQECTDKYWLNNALQRPSSIEERQIININNGAQIAANLNCEWMIHIDSDELLYCKNLKQTLSNTTEDAVKFEVLEAIPSKVIHESIFDTTLFKRNTNKYKIKLASFLGVKKAIFNNEFFRGHSQSKMAFKLNRNIDKYYIHSAEKKGGLVHTSSKKILLLHFDCIGIDAWKTKWNRRIDGTATALEMRQNRCEQQYQYAEAKARGNKSLTKLYQSLYLVPSKELFILNFLGMLKKINHSS